MSFIIDVYLHIEIVFPIKRREYSDLTVFIGNVGCLVTHCTSRYVIFSCSLRLKVHTCYDNNTFGGRMKSGF
jgi:hypothetical protein